MTLQFSNFELTDKEFTSLSRLIHEKVGIKLGDHKRELLKNRLRKRLNTLRLKSFSEYFKYIMEDDHCGTEMSEMLTAISTNVTFFFREEDHFEFLKSTVLPEIVKDKKRGGVKKIRGWSAGCSSGEEVYSIAITIREFLEDPTLWDTKLLASDISTKTLDIAVRGIYLPKALKTIPAHLVSNYFTTLSTDERRNLQVKDKLKSMVSVRHLNLQDKVYPFKGQFDFIFCRNVLIYFDKPTQRELVGKYHKYLKTGGYLFLGHSEGMAGHYPGFKYAAPAVYKKQ
ncbi:MAG: protein-glutamate O-methyltransferase CheR [Deltaproteobacteria bacterium]|nr:protein-glutamate O-methyltransferase CheR [Deltaproteobacteria bacterium]